MKHWLIFVFVLGCREDVQLLLPMSVDGSPNDGMTTTDGGDAIAPMCVATGGTCDVDRPCCANRCTRDGTCMGACQPDGMSCMSSQDCCGLDCNGGTCQPPALCKATGAMCTSTAECCCGSCMGGQCIVGVLTLGATCPVGQDWHCVQGFCNNGICQMNLTCKGNGFGCTVNHDCCLGYCFMGFCENPSCTPSG